MANRYSRDVLGSTITSGEMEFATSSYSGAVGAGSTYEHIVAAGTYYHKVYAYADADDVCVLTEGQLNLKDSAYKVGASVENTDASSHSISLIMKAHSS